MWTHAMRPGRIAVHMMVAPESLPSRRRCRSPVLSANCRQVRQGLPARVGATLLGRSRQAVVTRAGLTSLPLTAALYARLSSAHTVPSQNKRAG